MSNWQWKHGGCRRTGRSLRESTAVVLTATEGTAEIPPMGIPWMRQKAHSAVATVGRAPWQTGMIARNGIMRQLMLTNKRVGANRLMPIRTKW